MKLPALKEIVEDRKEKAIESLSDSYAKNNLPLEEYERLVEYINKIESERELVVVEKIAREYACENAADDAPHDAAHKAAHKPANYDDDDDEVDYYRSSTNFANNLSLFSARTYSGPVKSGSQFVSVFGSSQIIIRKEDLRKRKTVLNVVSIMGDNTIYVESGIRVVNKVIPILGSSDVNQKVKRQAEDEDPEIVISGAALLGNISVKLLKN